MTGVNTRYSSRASVNLSCMQRLKSSTHSAGQALVMPETQPVAPRATLSTIRSSTPQKRLKRSPSAIDRSVMRRMSPVSSLMQTICGVSASDLEDLWRDVHPIRDRIVVDHDRKRGSGGNALVPRGGFPRVRLVAQTRKDHQTLGTQSLHKREHGPCAGIERDLGKTGKERARAR